jgi:multimeric flavodoxin WrbA
MNRREFVEGVVTVAGAAVIHGFTFANEGEKKMKTAVVYYSWSGNTRFAAETIAKKAGADIFEIKAKTPYNSNFNKCCDEAKPECQGKTEGQWCKANCNRDGA